MLVDFVNTYSQEEKIHSEKVVEYFHALQKKDKAAVLKKIKVNSKLIEKISKRAANRDPLAKKVSEFEIVNFTSKE